jgi:hypothetical protein
MKTGWKRFEEKWVLQPILTPQSYPFFLICHAWKVDNRTKTANKQCMLYACSTHIAYLQLVRLSTILARHFQAFYGCEYECGVLLVGPMFFRLFCSQKYTLSFGNLGIFLSYSIITKNELDHLIVLGHK